MAVAFRRTKCAEATTPLKLNDIDPAGKYEITWQDSPDKAIVEGARLLSFPVKIDATPGSAILYYRKVQQ